MWRRHPAGCPEAYLSPSAERADAPTTPAGTAVLHEHCPERYGGKKLRIWSWRKTSRAVPGWEVGAGAPQALSMGFSASQPRPAALEYRLP